MPEMVSAAPGSRPRLPARSPPFAPRLGQTCARRMLAEIRALPAQLFGVASGRPRSGEGSMTDRRPTKQLRIAANVLPMQVWLEAAASEQTVPGERAKYPSRDCWATSKAPKPEIRRSKRRRPACDETPTDRLDASIWPSSPSVAIWPSQGRARSRHLRQGRGSPGHRGDSPARRAPINRSMQVALGTIRQ